MVTSVLDLDPILVNISWRENIHLELTFEVEHRLDGSALTHNGPPGVVDLEPGESPNYVSAIEEIYSRGPLTNQLSGTVVEPYGVVTPNEQLKFLFIDKQANTYLVPTERRVDGSLLVSINITTFSGRREIPDGEWSIYPVIDELIGAPVRLDLSNYQHLADLSRVFQHTASREAITVTFALTEDEVRPEIRLHTFHYSRPGTQSAAKRRKELVRRPVLAIRSWVIRTVFWAARLTRSRQTTTILFASEQRSKLEGNLKAVHDRLLERGLDRQFEIRQHFWIATNRQIATRIAQTIEIARANYLVIDDFFPGLDSLKVDESLQIIQAWHAGVGFKSVGYARFGNAGSPPLENAHRKYTWAIAGSKALVPVYADVFGVEPSAVIPTGLPRIDGFLAEKGRDKALSDFRAAYPEVADRKLILFAPTYRGRGIRDAYYDYGHVDFDALYEFCGEDTVVGFRMHHFITDRTPIPSKYADRLIDLSRYPDGLGLLHSTDVLITDYSSIIYEYALLDRPMVFFAYDRDAYAATRGFQQDYDETAPGKVCLTFEDLLETLRSEDYEREKVAVFRERNFDQIDTASSDRFIDRFFLEAHPEGNEQ